MLCHAPLARGQKPEAKVSQLANSSLKHGMPYLTQGSLLSYIYKIQDIINQMALKEEECSSGEEDNEDGMDIDLEDD